MEKVHPKTPESQKISFSETNEWLDHKWVTARFKEGEIDWEVRAREGFHAAEEIKRVEGPTIEVAGPTDEGFFFHDIEKRSGRPHNGDLFKERKVFVSNLYPGNPQFTQGQFSHFFGTADFIADARRLPLKNAEVGALFCSCFGEVAPAGVAEIERSGFKKLVPRMERERKDAPRSLFGAVSGV